MRKRLFQIALILAALPAPAFACRTALLLATDVSSSIDAGEYRLQVDGIADALLDPEIADVLVQDQVALSVLQWSGAAEQELVISWRRMISAEEVRDFSQRVRAMPRLWSKSSTATGDALNFAVDQFGPVFDCERQVIDMSGDGAENIGSDTATESRRAEAAGVEINGLAIDEVGLSITEFYRRFVITKDGFVETSRGYLSYPETIRRKLLRELTKPTV